MKRIHWIAAAASATVLLTGSGVGVALAAGTSRTYRGHTSQHQAFKLVASGKTVKKVAFKWVGSCQGSTKKLVVPFSATGLAVKDRKFSDSQPGYVLTGQKGLYGGAQIKKLSGHVSKRRTTGSFSFQGVLFSKKQQFGVCTGSGTWHATRG